MFMVEIWNEENVMTSLWRQNLEGRQEIAEISKPTWMILDLISTRKKENEIQVIMTFS